LSVVPDSIAQSAWRTAGNARKEPSVTSVTKPIHKSIYENVRDLYDKHFFKNQ
jgi:hypothetical protein